MGNLSHRCCLSFHTCCFVCDVYFLLSEMEMVLWGVLHGSTTSGKGNELDHADQPGMSIFFFSHLFLYLPFFLFCVK